MSGLKDKHYISRAARANDKNKVSSCSIEICSVEENAASYALLDHVLHLSTVISLLLSWGNLLCFINNIYDDVSHSVCSI